MSQEVSVNSHGGLPGKGLVDNKKEDVNILVLGETGVGKSTWINGIANYAKHETLQDAMDDPEFTFLIPSRFIFTDENGEAKEIKFGSDENEVFGDGQSATQFPREYVIETDTKNFHLIDTPGIGDSRGIEQDEENFDNILAFLTRYEKINAVVMLLKPNNTRLTTAFKFCVVELLSHLHKSVVSNIIFAFTNTRGTMYRPGESLPVLNKLLKEYNIKINLSSSSYFCFDNEAFRFLACSKNGVKFTPKEVDLYSNSWVKSWETTDKLFQFVTTMKPHETKKTLSLNEARSCVIAMSKPMGQAVELIKKNVKSMNDAKDQCKMDDADIKKFQKNLKFKAFELEIKQLDYPVTVCADKICKKYVEVGTSTEKNTVYPQICHDRCSLKGIPVETTNNEQLRRCTVMAGGRSCIKCKHYYKSHMHITYTADLVEKEYLSKEAQDLIKNRTDVKAQKKAFITELDKLIKELEEEKEIIVDSASFFGAFLNQNALIPYNDSFSEYLDMQIREEEAKEDLIRDDKKIEQLENEKRAYEEKKNVITKNIKDAITSGSKDKKEVIPIEKVEQMRKQLCSLKHNGKTLSEALAVVISARNAMHRFESNTISRRVRVLSQAHLQRKFNILLLKGLVENKKDVNILILGETGVGKSTWINGIANYAKHNTLKDAMDDSEFTVLIPSRFIFTNEEGRGIEIKVGSDANEVLVSGQSATQFPREYVIETNTTRFHLIDTPGIGDCRGIEQDKENFDNILAFLTCYDKINAVVVLFKPNNARLTVAFRFCVLELLTHLHKSVVSNIIFAFTNSRGTFYRPGDSLPVLIELLKERNIENDLSPKSYFCFDNEAFRFLACSKNGINFEPEEVDLYSKSWVKSCETTGKLFQFVTTMKPHETKKTLSLNDARSYIIAMSKPMAQAVQLIEKNVKSINDAKDQCKMEDADIQEFQKNLKFKAFELEIKQLDYPLTVCAAEECKTYVYVGESGERNTVYKQICHSRCYLKGIPVETTNNEQLRNCRAMSGGNCTECTHDYRCHMHMTYTADLVEKEFLSKKVQDLIQQKADVKSQKEAFILELETHKKELEKEKETIYDSASFFGVFLKENAMIPYNDSFSEYLDMLIREEEAKEDLIRDDKKIEQLKNDKRAYEERKNVIMRNITDAITSGSKDKKEVIPIEKVEQMRQALCSLKHNGKTLSEALGVATSARKKILKVERVNVVIAKRGMFTKFSDAFSKMNPFNRVKST